MLSDAKAAGQLYAGRPSKKPSDAEGFSPVRSSRAGSGSAATIKLTHYPRAETGLLQPPFFGRPYLAKVLRNMAAPAAMWGNSPVGSQEDWFR